MGRARARPTPHPPPCRWAAGSWAKEGRGARALPILSCPILFYPTLSYPILPYPNLSTRKLELGKVNSMFA